MRKLSPTRIMMILVPIWLVFGWIGFVDNNPISDGYSKGGDLYALYMAGVAYQAGLPELVYASPENFFSGDMPGGWGQLMISRGMPESFAFPYLYPPLWVGVVAPLTDIVSMHSFGTAVLIAHILMLAALPWMALKLVGATDAPWAALWLIIAFGFMVGTTPFQSALFFNQLQITSSFLIVAGLLAYRGDRAVMAGVLIGLAASIKIVPALFGLIFLLDRNWRAAAVTALTGIALLLASIAMMGVDLHQHMLAQFQKISAMTPIGHSNWALESLLYEVHRWLTSTPMPDTSNEVMPVLNAPAWVQTTPRMLLILGIALTAALSWSAPAKSKLGLQVLALSLLLALMGPLGWSHYFTLPLLLLPCLIPPSPTGRFWAIFLGIGAVISMVMFQTLLPLNALAQATVIGPALVMLALLLWTFPMLGSSSTSAR
ncbi:glycosyltransferase family 87 protein [Actibacterium pelagium]|uniref:DUF2029 domain-containing protein n=1 Tax=Actibacterium pelagium TaxID=2029103 RepID=A0A917AFX1_9RHOB|nr:glycosyltransferase family 87 protein [Actibacterium pelagium]GGE47974.1 hypothetical protein GCM10011517_14740 [Actibacterium pelagium]